MTDSDLTISILRDIRDAILSTNAATNTRIDETNARLDETNARLESGFARTDARLLAVDSTLQELASQVLLIGRYLKNRTEIEIEDLRLRVTRLETKLG